MSHGDAHDHRREPGQHVSPHDLIPKNLYLCSVSGISLGAFLAVTLPYTVLSGVLLASVCFVLPGTPVAAGDTGGETEPLTGGDCWAGWCFFAVCLLEVLGGGAGGGDAGGDPGGGTGGEPEAAAAGGLQPAGHLCVPLVFIGNMKRFPPSTAWLAQVLGRACASGIGGHQPDHQQRAGGAAALRFYGRMGRILLEGTNIGGLGTLIASMAALISY